MSTSIFEEWIYDHRQYKDASDMIVEEIDRALNGGTPFIFPLLGDSRAGKSALLKDVCKAYVDKISPSGHRRVLLVAMPASASLEALAKTIVTAILGNIEVKGKPKDVIDHARQVMEAAGVKVLMIDEVNHLVEKRATERAQTKANRHFADWIKMLYELSKISLVIAGLPHVARIYLDNDQLENRGLVGTRIDAYAWSRQEERAEFAAMVEAAVAEMIEHGWVMEVEPDWLTRLAYLGSGGYIGKARDFMVRIEEMGAAKKRIYTKLCLDAYKSKFKVSSDMDPAKLKILDDILLNRAHQLALERALRSGRGAQA